MHIGAALLPPAFLLDGTAYSFISHPCLGLQNVSNLNSEGACSIFRSLLVEYNTIIL